MENDFLLKELKNDIGSRKAFQEQLSIYQETMKRELETGVGEEIKADLRKNESLTLKNRIIRFFYKILNTL